MEILQLQNLYATHSNVKALAQVLENSSTRTIFLQGLCASSSALYLSCILKISNSPFLVILDDLEGAGYFYHDLTQILGDERVLFFLRPIAERSNTDRRMPLMKFFVRKF